MDRAAFKELLAKKVLILDGAMGTQLQKAGMPTGVCPELWTLEHPDTTKKILKAYIDAGSDIIYTPTFGGNRLKLGEYGLESRVGEINRGLAAIAKQVLNPGCFAAGDLGPTGKFIKPLGELDFEEIVSIYKEQAEGLLAGGVDLFVIETVMDLQEARAALIAVRESCTLPVMVSVTYDEKKRTISGTDPVTALITLQSLGADAVGCNCSTGPAGMLEILTIIKPYASVPLLLKPNAGLPKFVDGKTLFEMGAGEFGTYAEAFVNAGANLLGGCCGTSPEFIGELEKKSDGLNPVIIKKSPLTAMTSNRRTVFWEEGAKPNIGESIRLSESEGILSELGEGKYNKLMRLASDRQKSGEEIITINPDGSGLGLEQLINLTEALGASYPLCFESSDHEVLKACLRVYPGRAAIKMPTQEESRDKILAAAENYGAVVID